MFVLAKLEVATVLSSIALLSPVLKMTILTVAILVC